MGVFMGCVRMVCGLCVGVCLGVPVDVEMDVWVCARVYLYFLGLEFVSI